MRSRPSFAAPRLWSLRVQVSAVLRRHHGPLRLKPRPRPRARLTPQGLIAGVLARLCFTHWGLRSAAKAPAAQLGLARRIVLSLWPGPARRRYPLCRPCSEPRAQSRQRSRCTCEHASGSRLVFLSLSGTHLASSRNTCCGLGQCVHCGCLTLSVLPTGKAAVLPGREREPARGEHLSWLPVARFHDDTRRHY